VQALHPPQVQQQQHHHTVVQGLQLPTWDPTQRCRLHCVGQHPPSQPVQQQQQQQVLVISQHMQLLQLQHLSSLQI
jgi:hypothetical protein